jgi:hypothetical protein
MLCGSETTRSFGLCRGCEHRFIEEQGRAW